MIRFIIACGLVVGIFSGTWVTAQVGPPNLKHGQALYAQHCARCHGENGNGLEPDAQPLIVPPANFKSLNVRSKTDEEFLMAISKGVLFSAMHGWRAGLVVRPEDDGHHRVCANAVAV